MNSYKEIVLRPGKEESLKRFHPWIFSGAIGSKPIGLEEGEVVRVLASDGSSMGVGGHYQIGSIAVRMLSFNDEQINEQFYMGRLENAFMIRRELNLIRSDNNTFRLVHGEGDHLPGLIIDIYGNTAVVQAHSVGIHRDIGLITDALNQVMPSGTLKNIFYKSEGTLPYKAGLYPEDRYLSGGEDVSDTAMENGLKFHIDWLKGQKPVFH